MFDTLLESSFIQFTLFNLIYFIQFIFTIHFKYILKTMHFIYSIYLNIKLNIKLSRYFKTILLGTTMYCIINITTDVFDMHISIAENSTKSTINEVNLSNLGTTANLQNISNSSSIPNNNNSNIKEDAKIDDMIHNIDLPKNFGSINKHKIIRINGTSNSKLFKREIADMCANINRDLYYSGYRCKALFEEEPIAVVNNLRNAKTDFILLPVDLQKDAFSGNDAFNKDQPYDKLRFLFSLHYESLAIIVKRDSEIIKLDDLKGKIIAIGKIGSNAKEMFNNIVEAKGWNYETTFKATPDLNPEEQVYELCKGSIDAMVVMGSQPNEFIKNVTQMCETTLIDINDDSVTNFIKNNTEYIVGKINGGTYLGNPFDIKTIASKVTMLSSSDVDNDLVYIFVKNVLNNIDSLKRIDIALSELTLNDMFQNGRSIPMHTGVERYLKEIKYDTKNLGIITEDVAHHHSVNGDVKNN